MQPAEAPRNFSFGGPPAPWQCYARDCARATPHHHCRYAPRCTQVFDTAEEATRHSDDYRQHAFVFF